MKTKHLLLFIPFLLIGNVLSAQFQKGDWWVDFQLNNKNYKVNSAEQPLTNLESNWNSRVGKFLSNEFLVGVGYSLSTGNYKFYQTLDRPFCNVFQTHIGHGFFRYYMPGKNVRRALFIAGDFQYNFTKGQVTSNQINEDPQITKGLQFDVGIGFSLFHFPNAALEFSLDYDLLTAKFKENKESLDLDRGEVRFHIEFVQYLNRKGQSKFSTATGAFLKKGRRMIGGNLDLNFMGAGGGNNVLDLNGFWLYFLTEKWSIGAAFPVNVTFGNRNAQFDYALGPLARYYQPITKRLQVFGHLALMSNNVGNAYWLSPFVAGTQINAETNLDTEFGIGMNFFLAPDLSCFWLYKYEVYQPFDEYNFKYWNRSKTSVNFEMGLAFLF